jgi:DNA-binding NtrC family response regulator
VNVSSAALHALMDYNFPGNVRELENVIERAVVLSSGPVITPDLLPDNIVGRNSALSMIGSRPDASLFDIMEDAERRIIGEMLEKCAWNQTEAAKRFRIPLSTLNQKIKRLGIELEKRTIRENPA